MHEQECSGTAAGSVSSTRYQDYVIRDGQYIGQFEDMYQNAAEIPWHQDETVNAIFSDLTVAILKRHPVCSLLDVGCGMGYMAARLKSEIPGLTRVVGLDISPTATAKAAAMFPDIEFRAGTLGADAAGGETFDVVVSKDVLWYVLDDLKGYVANLAGRSQHWVYIGQSFPECKPFLGMEILPDAQALLNFLVSEGYTLAYSLVERDGAYGGREYVHVLIEVSQ